MHRLLFRRPLQAVAGNQQTQSFSAIRDYIVWYFGLESSAKNNSNFQFFRRKELKPLTALDAKLSDHNMATTELPDKTVMLIFNTMMPNAKKIIDNKTIYNNGFNVAQETDEEYCERIGRMMTVLWVAIRNNPKITVLALQEAPIHHRHLVIMAEYFELLLPEWNTASFEGTNFGVMTFIRDGRNEKCFAMDQQLANQLGKQAERFLTMKNEKSHKISSIHAVHGNPVESMMSIFKIVIKDAVLNNIHRHDIGGDFNADAAVINQVLQDAWHAVCAELKNTHPQLNYQLQANFDSSPDVLHQKSTGEKIETDGVLSLRFEKTNENQYQFNFQHFSLRPLFAFLFGGSVLTTATTFAAK